MTVQPQSRLRWYAVLCENVRCMDKTQKEIGRLGIPVFVPRAYREEKQGKWMVSVDDGYLLPRFLFVAMRSPGPWKSRSSMLWGALCDVRGVQRIMGNYDRMGTYRPMAIRYKEMRRIRTKHNAGERRLEADRFKEGQTVKIMGGVFAGFDGIFDKPVKDRLSIFVSLFGRQSPVELEEHEVKAA